MATLRRRSPLSLLSVFVIVSLLLLLLPPLPDTLSSASSHLTFASALGIGTKNRLLKKKPHGPLVWNTEENSVKLLLKHTQNVTAAGDSSKHSCLVFLLYSTDCPFSKEFYHDFEQLSQEYLSVAFVAMEKSLSSLNFLMQFGFQAVPQVLIYSPVSLVFFSF